MTDALALRTELDAARLARDTARAEMDDQEVRRRRLLAWIDSGPTTIPHGQTLDQIRDRAEQEAAEAQARLDRLKDEFERVRDRLARHLDREDPLFGDRSDDPVALLPVRLETRFAGRRGGRLRLRVRVYPDDLHVVALDPALTPRELAAGRDHWRAVARVLRSAQDAGEDAGEDTGEDTREEALRRVWQRTVDRAGPGRAPWVAEATRPGAPAPERRAPGRRRAPRVTTLPDRWRFLGVAGGEVMVDRKGRPIPNPLPLGLLQVDQDGPEGHADWLVDFRAAERVGMAVTLTLPEGVGRLDQLLVVGVQQADPGEATPRLHHTLRSHAFTSGLGFLAPGTPTNNTPASRSDWSSQPRPPRPRTKPPELVPDSDGHRLAAALGVRGGDFRAACAGGRRDTEGPIRAMTMLGYAGCARQAVGDAVRRMDVVGPPAEDLDPRVFLPVRRHLVRSVRSRGTLPTIRVGRQPYGVLEVTSLDEWRPEGGPDQQVEEKLVLFLLRLRHHWRSALAPGWIPRVSDGRPADRTAVEALTRLPTAKDLVVRRVRSPEENIARFDQTSLRTPGPALALGGIGFDSALRWATPTELTSNLAWTSSTTPPDFGLVAERLAPDPARDREMLERTAAKYADAVALLRRRIEPGEYGRRWIGPDFSPRPRTLFDLPARPTFVIALLDVANWSGAVGGPDDLTAALGIPATMDQLASDARQGAPEEDLRLYRRAARPGLARAEEVLERLRTLAAVPEGGLLPLVLELLEVFSHRWDAWASSLAAGRRFELRASGRSGVRLGGYGWVENLAPAPRPAPAPGGGPAGGIRRSPGDGYVHAPSLQHAATAAVLRSGFLAHPGERTFAVDLSSRRMRAARWLLAGVRRGQDLGALLGYRFERALHDAHLDQLVGLYRARFPILTVPPAAGAGGDESTWARSHDAIAARNVVDGMRLAQDPERVVDVLRETGETDLEPVRRIAADLADVLDAVGDLVLAESVHQMIGGNPLRAGLAADTLGGGEQVPDRFEVLSTPRRGRAVTHRLLTVLPARPRRSHGWARDALADLDPRLDCWVAHLLGPARRWRLAGAVRNGDEVTRFDTTAAALGFSALGMLLVGDEHRGRLDRRLREIAGRPAGDVVLRQGWRELSTVLGAARTVLAGAQPLLPDRLPGQGGEPADGASRARADLAELRARVAGFADLADEAAVRRDLGLRDPPRRLRAALRRDVQEPGWLADVTAALAEVLGVSVPLAPVLRGAELPAVRSDVPGSDVEAWVRRYAAVRPALRGWQDLVTLAAVRAGAAPPLAVLQQPAEGPWVGGAFPPHERPPAREHWVRHDPLPVSGAFAGYVCDEWAEVLPGADALSATKEGRGAVPVESELTGVSFHFDRPDAKAPQAVLLAVPPDRRRGWTADTLALVVRDTLELAKLRAVDLADLPLLDDLLPAVRSARLDTWGTLAADFWEELAD